MKTQTILSAVLAAVFVIAAGLPAPAHADDAEIYIGTPDTIPEASQALIMFSLDYGSNLSSRKCGGTECDFLFNAGYMDRSDTPYTYFKLLRGVLRYVLEAPIFGPDGNKAPLAGVKVGLMLNHADVNKCEGKSQAGCSNGGYIAMGFQELKSDDSNDTKKTFRDLLKSIPEPKGSQSHPYQGRELFYEFYRYLKGMNVYNGFNGYTSYDTAKSQNSTNIPDQANYRSRWEGTFAEDIKGFSWDPATVSGNTYNDPLAELGACAKIYTINLMFQVSDHEADSDGVIKADIGLSDKCSSVGCEFAGMIDHLYREDFSTADGLQGVTSFFLGEEPHNTNNKFKAYASAGGTGSALPLSEDPTILIETLKGVLDQILSISTTFTAAALPVNSFDRANVLDDVFISLFQPQNERFPANNAYWWGNVKKLKMSGLGSATEVVELRDARDQPAVAADGRLRFEALTFWTDPAAEDVVDAGRDPAEGAVSGRDGRSVNRGGAGHKIPGFPRDGTSTPGTDNPGTSAIQAATGPRRVLYDSGADTLAALNASDSVAAALQSTIGAASTAEAKNVIRFMRGLDELDQSQFWMFGAAMHSRPVPVNYGAAGSHSAANPLIYVAVGANDGALRFILNTDSTGTERGQEVWAFIPTEVMRNVRDIVNEAEPKLRPGLEGDSTIYGFDGTPTLYLEDQNGDGTVQGTDKAILYAGLRRGGRAYYALDVSDPLDPKLLWKIVGGAGGTPGFENLGWAFSQPRIGRMDLPTGGVQPVVIFAGGYDRTYDDQSAAPDPASALGKGIYVVNAEDGSLIRHVLVDGMLDSMPAAVTAVDTNGSGLLDRMYIGDLGGRIWRVDMTPGVEASTWPVSLLADLGRHAAGAAAGTPDDRRFYNTPDVVQSKKRFDEDDLTSETLQFDAVLIGSGDRENPLYNVPSNWFFMIRDLNIGVLPDPANTTHRVQDFTDVTNTTGEEVPISSPGWALELTTAGEKNLAASVTVANTVFFTTYIPPGASDASVDQCGPSEGSGRLYTVSLQNANPPRNRDEVINDNDVLDPSDRWEDLKSGGIPAEVVVIPPDRILRPDLDVDPVPMMTRWRTFWHLDEDPVQ